MREIDNSAGWDLISPKPVYLIATKGKNGKTNVMTACWAMQTSHSPVLVLISVGKERHSYNALHKTKEFVLAVPNCKMEKEALFCGTASGRDADKIAKLGIETESAKSIKAPLLKNCVANMECKVIKEIQTGDHALFLGKVLHTYRSKKFKEILFDCPHYKMNDFESALTAHLLTPLNEKAKSNKK